MTFNVRVLDSGKPEVLDDKGHARCWALVQASTGKKHFRIVTGNMLVEVGTRCRLKISKQGMSLIL